MNKELCEFFVEDLIKTPVAYLLKNNTVEDLTQKYDDNGWTMLHWAVAQPDLEKIKEFIYFDLDFTILSKKNLIATDVYCFSDKKKIDIKNLPVRIPFCIHGFSPFHLILFLYDYYSNISKDFFYVQKAKSYFQVISYFLHNQGNFLKVQDSNHNSIFDYAFLLENISLIELFIGNESTLESLNNIDCQIAKKIIDVISIKKGTSFNKDILTSLDKIILCKNLELQLPQKNNQKNISKI